MDDFDLGQIEDSSERFQEEERWEFETQMEQVEVSVGSSCVECGADGPFGEDICYECQTILHSLGMFDMDGQGWM